MAASACRYPPYHVGVFENSVRPRLKEDFTLIVWWPGPVAVGLTIASAVVGSVVLRPEGGWSYSLLLQLVERVSLASAVVYFLCAEWLRPGAANRQRVISAQSMWGAGIVVTGGAIGALGTRLRAGDPALSDGYVQVVWALSAFIMLVASFRIVTTTRRLVLEGSETTQRVLTAEYRAQATELMALQLKVEPDLMMRVMSAIAEQSRANPAAAERAVEGLSAYLRQSLAAVPTPTLSMRDEIARARDYLQLLMLAGVTVPITWNVDDDVLEQHVPGSALRTLLGYAIARCQRDSAPSEITVRAYQHARRFYLVVIDTAAADPPALAEPDGLRALRVRLGAPPQRRVRVVAHAMLEVDGVSRRTTQTLSFVLPEAA